jgi:FkbM family methyltransferase
MKIKKYIYRIIEIFAPSVAREIYFSRHKIEKEINALPIFIKKDSVLIDVGANIGHYLYYANKIISTGLILGYEPNPLPYKTAYRLFYGEDNVRLYDIAMGSVRGSAALYFPSVKNVPIASRSTLNNLNNFSKNYKDIEKITVEVSTIDESVDSEGLNRVDFVKIDVEGFEYEVIKGSSKTIQLYKPIFLIEIEQQHAPYVVVDIFLYFIQQKYFCYIYTLDGIFTQLNEEQFIKVTSNSIFKSSHSNNFFFIPKEKLNLLTLNND